MRASHLLALCGLLAISSCQVATPLTQVIVIIDSDLNVPIEMNGLRIFARSPLEGEFRLINGRLMATGPESLPRSVAFTHRGGPLGLIELRVEGQLDGAIVIAQGAEFSFRPEQTLALHIELRRSCLGVVCASGETCRDGSCDSVIIGIEDLTPYDGIPNPIAPSPPPADAGVDGAGTDSDSGEPCSTCPISPSNVGDRLPITGTAFSDLTLAGSSSETQVYVLDTDYGSITQTTPETRVIRESGESDTGDYGFATLPSIDTLGPGLGVFQVGSLNIEEGAVLYARGSRALILLVRASAEIAGTVSVSHDRGFDPSGGVPAGSNSGGDSNISTGGIGEDGQGPYGGPGGRIVSGPTRSAGGHGGGMSSRGGSGGGSDVVPSDRVHTDEGIEPLLGGSGGGAGAPQDNSALRTARGGSGGGAIQITAGTYLRLLSTGLLEAEGQGGAAALGYDGGGGGGGSGGSILLEAPNLTIEGALRAAGGGGGAGRGCGRVSCEGDAGASRSSGASPAPGGSSGPMSRAGDGGDGSDATGSDGLAGESGERSTAGGGGGGGAGRIRLNSDSPPLVSGPIHPSLASSSTSLGSIQRAAP